MQCEVCGSELAPSRGNPEGLALLPNRLCRRAQEGAARLRIVYQQGNVHSRRRIGLTLQVAGVIAPELRHGALFSQNRIDRFKTLAAINLGMTRPLLAAALTLKSDRVGETKLRIAFPHKRKLVDRLARLSESLPRQRSLEGGASRTNRGRTARVRPMHQDRSIFRRRGKPLISLGKMQNGLICSIARRSSSKTRASHRVDISQITLPNIENG